MVIRSKFGTSLEASLFGPFGLNAMTRFLTMNNDMKRMSSTTFRTSSSYIPRWHGIVFSNTSEISVFSTMGLLQGFDNT